MVVCLVCQNTVAIAKGRVKTLLSRLERVQLTNWEYDQILEGLSFWNNVLENNTYGDHKIQQRALKWVTHYNKEVNKFMY